MIIKKKFNKDSILFNYNNYTKKYIDKKNFICYIYIKFIKKCKNNIPVVYII